MKDRVIGIENEYPFNIMDERDVGDPYTTQDSTLFDKALTDADETRGVWYQPRLWLPNGGCIYTDRGKVEWASPECRRVHDVVLYNKVGERAVHSVAQSDRRLKGLTHLFKTNVAPRKEIHGSADGDAFRNHVSMGCHENYMTNGVEDISQNLGIYLRLIPFLVTRQVYGGSGWFVDGRGDSFWRSQRAAFIDFESGMNTTLNRGIINTRHRPYTTVRGMGRFHMIMGDANMLEYALYLKVGATMLMMALLEEQLLPPLFIKAERDGEGASSPDSIMAFRRLSQEHDLNKKVLFLRDVGSSSWESVSGLEVQARYCELAHRYVRATSFDSDESEHEARTIVDMWRETLAALARNDASFLDGRIDWYTKRRLAARAIRHKRRRGVPHVPSEVRMELDLLYHEVGENTLYQSLAERDKVVRFTTDEEIREAMKGPPPPTPARGTRASVRGHAVALFMRSTDGKKSPVIMRPLNSWEGFELNTRDSNRFVCRIPLNDPLQYNSAIYDEITRLLAAGVPTEEWPRALP